MAPLPIKTGRLRGNGLTMAAAKRETGRWGIASIAATNSWHDADNWVGDTVPVTGDDVCIPIVTALTATYSTSSLSINSLKSDEPFQVSGGTLTIATVSSLSTLNNQAAPMSQSWLGSVRY